MGATAADVAFIIALEEQSYREEEEMRKEAEVERKNLQANMIPISGDAKKGAGLFKVCAEDPRHLLGVMVTFGRLDANSAIPHKQDRTKSAPVCMASLGGRLAKSKAFPTPTPTSKKASNGMKRLW